MASHDDTVNPYYLLKLKIRSRMPTEKASFEKLVYGFKDAVRAEGVNMSRAARRRLLRDILADMADELLGGW